MSSSEDLSNFESYDRDKGEDLPLTAKKTRLIAAVMENNVEELKLLLDSPELHDVRDHAGNSLLQMAILAEKIDVFNFLLSIEDYPLEAVSKTGDTALIIALSGSVAYPFVPMDDHFAVELIKQGAYINSICFDNNTLLHCAIERNFVKAAQLLIENGIDLNRQNNAGQTPLHIILCRCNRNGDPIITNEIVSMLLYYGADASIHDAKGFTPFDEALKWHTKNVFLTETLFYHTVDEYSQYKLHDCLLPFVAESPLFHTIIHNVTDIVWKDCFYYASMLLSVSVKPENLKRLIENFKFDHVISQILNFQSCDYSSASVENFQVLLESHLASDVIAFIGKMMITHVVKHLHEGKRPETMINDFVFYLLTYGINVYDQDLETVYKLYGYSELFKILLQMDVKKHDDHQLDIMPALIYDVGIDLECFLQDPHNYSLNAVEQLFSYFAHPGLKAFCYNLNIQRLSTRAESLPRIPLLVELARNAFRKFLIKKFHVTTSKQFYFLLKWLPISVIHKKIISYETKLY